MEYRNVIDDDPLKDVPTEEIPNMLFRMRSNFPLAIHAHQYLQTILKWKKSNQDLNIAILAPSGDYKLGVIFYTIQEDEFKGSIYCHDDEEIKSMQKALITTKKVPIHNNKITGFTCLTEKSYEAIKPSVKDFSMHLDLVYWLPWYCAREIEIQLPIGVEIKKLSQEHVDQINEVWPHKYSGSKKLITDTLKFNFGYGVFRQNSLLSWAMYNFYGGIGAVQTEESEKRKGYGRAVVQALTKKLGDMQIDVHLNIVLGNEAAETLFKSLGFRYAFTAYWAVMDQFEKE